MKPALVGVVAGASLVLGACVDTQPCVQRGSSTQIAGSAAYSGQVGPDGGATTPVGGAVPAAVTIDDFTTTANSCSGNPVEFTVRAGSDCVLWTMATDTSGNASVEGGQTCTVPTAQGDAVLAIDQGTLSTSSSPTTLTLSGSITSLAGAVVGQGYLQWTFTGS